MAILEAQKIAKKYPGDVQAVADFSLTIDEGDFVVLLGPSGCGKTTVLRMIAGLETLDDGLLLLDGQDATALEPKKRDIALVFQNYALYPHMTVRKNIEFPLKMRKIPQPEIEDRVNDIAHKLGLEDLLARRPGALSGGQQQRVAIARALVRNPRILLMDEPLSNLDAQLRVQMRKELVSIHNDLRTTIIFVTHDQTEAMTLGTKIVVMKDGSVQQQGAPLQLYRHPRNAFVARFIGTPQMNLMPALLHARQESWCAQVGASEIALKGCTCLNKALLKEEKAILLGVRPEGIGFVGTHSGAARALEAAVAESVASEAHFEAHAVRFETLGSEGYLHADFQGIPLSIRTGPSCTITEGAPLYCSVKPNEWHIFDAKSQETMMVAL